FQAPADVSLARFRAGRAELAAILRNLEPAAWERTGDIVNHPSASGAVSIEAWVMAITGHDGYHLQQIAQWIKPGNE
ncbi:MAG: DinB family protein, partial [Armatimonadota bacterium]|nr:DinB family protein [Armatimonadota bacterium]